MTTYKFLVPQTDKSLPAIHSNHLKINFKQFKECIHKNNYGILSNKTAGMNIQLSTNRSSKKLLLIKKNQRDVLNKYKQNNRVKLINNLITYKTRNETIMRSCNYLPMLRIQTSLAEVLPGSEYDIGSIIGKGAYAVVKDGVHKLTNVKYAFKIYEKTRLFDPKRKVNVIREINNLRKLDHPNIVKLHNTFNTSQELILVLELIKGESLRNYLNRKEGKVMLEDEAKDIIRQILSAIAHCHEQKI